MPLKFISIASHTECFWDRWWWSEGKQKHEENCRNRRFVDLPQRWLFRFTQEDGDGIRKWMTLWIALHLAGAYCSEWGMSNGRRGCCRCCASLGNLCSSFCDIAPPLIPKSNSVLSPNKIPTGPRRRERDPCDVMKILLISSTYLLEQKQQRQRKNEWLVLLDVPVIARLVYLTSLCAATVG